MSKLEEDFISEILTRKQKAADETGMDISTIDFNKESVMDCSNFNDEVYEACKSRFCVCDSNIYDEDDFLHTLKPHSQKPSTKYR
jgi:hypothetical protein